MPKNVTIQVTTIPVECPPGVVPGDLKISIVELNLSLVADTLNTAIFNDVPAGQYTAMSARLDQGGVIMGQPISQLFTVPVDAPTTYESPQSMTVTIG